MNNEVYMFVPRNSLKPRHRPVNITGTANIATGYRFQEPKKVHYVKKPTDKITSYDNVLLDDTEESKNTKKYLSKLAFEQSTDKKIISRKVRNRIDQGTIAYEEKLVERRKKLQKMLLTEDSELARIVKEQIQKNSLQKKEEMKAQIEEAKRQEIENKQQEVTARRVQQYLARCPEVRNAFSKKSTVDVKFCNLAQVEQKAAQRQVEKETEVLWHNLSLKEIEAKKLQEKEDKRKKMQANIGVACSLKQQIAEKLAMQAEKMCAREEERKQLEELLKQIQQEKLCGIQKKREERQKLKKDLEKQLQIAKIRFAEHAKEEAALDRVFNSSNQEDLEERAALKKSSIALRNELLVYMKSIKEFREQEAKRDAEIDAIVRETAKEVEEKKLRAKTQEKEARQRELENVLKIRAKQVKEKQEMKEREKAQRDMESKMLEEQCELEERIVSYNNKLKREEAQRYGQELIAQQEYIESLRQREREEIERMYKRGLEREEEYQNMIQTLLNSSNISAPHTFNAQMDKIRKNIDIEISKAGIIS